jgi:hypothetical protein
LFVVRDRGCSKNIQYSGDNDARWGWDGRWRLLPLLHTSFDFKPRDGRKNRERTVDP